jgi:hypothetical protein
MAISPSRAVAVAAMTLLLLTLVGPTRADVPTAGDFAACNATAHHDMKGASASPNSSDHQRAETARTVAPAARTVEPVSRIVESGDPQIHGMESEGAKHAAFQAAYRSCMRRKGF